MPFCEIAKPPKIISLGIWELFGVAAIIDYEVIALWTKEEIATIKGMFAKVYDKFDKLDGDLDNLNGRLDNLNGRLDGLLEKTEGIEGKVEKISKV